MNRSYQRNLILDYIEARRNHPTAEDIYKGIRPIARKISLGTVYRNLNLLESNHMIARVHTPDGADHYDFDTSYHLHTFCMSCHKVENVNYSLPIEADTMCNKANKVYPGYMYGFYCCFYGYCHECLMEGRL